MIEAIIISYFLLIALVLVLVRRQRKYKEWSVGMFEKQTKMNEYIVQILQVLQVETRGKDDPE